MQMGASDSRVCGGGSSEGIERSKPYLELQRDLNVKNDKLLELDTQVLGLKASIVENDHKVDEYETRIVDYEHKLEQFHGQVGLLQGQLSMSGARLADA